MTSDAWLSPASIVFDAVLSLAIAFLKGRKSLTVELANLTSPTLAEVIYQAHQGIERVRRMSHLAYSFLRDAGLLVS